MASQLRVAITIDGKMRSFSAIGEGAVVVAAFRAWLAGDDCVLPAALGVDELDRMSGLILASAESIRRSRDAQSESEARENLLAEALGVIK